MNNAFINSKLKDLCRSINLNKLVPELLRNQFLVGDELTRYRNLPLSDGKIQKQHILLNCLVENNIQSFLHILLYTGHDEIAHLLAQHLLQVDFSDLTDLSRCDPKDGHESKFSFGDDRPMDVLVVNHNMNSTSMVYPLINVPRGYCLLLNNHFTIGTYKEMQRFRDIFFQLHFDVIMAKNMNKIDIINILKEISTRDELNNHCAFVFMVIAHGNSEHEIYGFDGEPIKIRDIMDFVNNDNCPKLRGKPRIFFFNCCRGARSQFDYPGGLNNGSGTSDSYGDKLPAIQDEFVCYSTLHGHTAQVDWIDGTRFGAALADSLVKVAWYKDLNRIVTRTNHLLINPALNAASKQLFEWNQNLVKELYFLPNVTYTKLLRLKSEINQPHEVEVMMV